MASFNDGTILVLVPIAVRGPNYEDFSGTDQTDLGGGLIIVNVEDSGYLVNLVALQAQCPEGDDQVNVAY